MVHDCWLVLTELLLHALLTSRGPDGGLRVAPSHGSLSQERRPRLWAAARAGSIALAHRGRAAGALAVAPDAAGCRADARWTWSPHWRLRTGPLDNRRTCGSAVPAAAQPHTTDTRVLPRPVHMRCAPRRASGRLRSALHRRGAVRKHDRTVVSMRSGRAKAMSS